MRGSVDYSRTGDLNFLLTEAENPIICKIGFKEVIRSPYQQGHFYEHLQACLFSRKKIA